MYDMKNPAGEAVRNYNMTFGASLVTCDVSDAGHAAARGGPAQGRHAQRVARRLTIEKPEHLACDISVIPRI